VSEAIEIVNSEPEVIELAVDFDSEVSARDAEAWAVGKRGGVDVSEDDPTYHNNSKYYSEFAESEAQEAIDTIRTAAEEIKDDSIVAINQAAEEARESIPSDYTQLSDDVTGLKSALERTSIPLVLVNNSYVKNTDGGFANYNGWKRTDKIDVAGVSQLIYYTPTKSDYNAFYDDQKTFISAFSLLAGKLNGNYRVLEVPSTAKYIALSGVASDMDNTILFPVSTLPMIQKSLAFSGFPHEGSYRAITVETHGTDIEVYIPQGLYADGVRYFGNYTYKSFPGQQTITIPDGSYLVADMDNATLSVMTFSQLQSVINTAWVQVLLYNNKGKPLGKLAELSNNVGERLFRYYQSYLLNKANTINTLKTAYGLNGFSFVFISDEHHQQSAGQSPKLIQYIRENTNIDRIINGGDIYTYHNTKAEAYKDICEYISLLKSTGCGVWSAIGNHEYNNPSGSSSQEALTKTLSIDEVVSCLYSGEEYDSCVFNSVDYSYYKDFGNLRVFFLPCNYASGIYLAPVRWILEQFQNVPNGYKVMVVSHVIIEWQEDITQATMIPRVKAIADGLDALKTKQTFQFDNRTYDYANTNADPVCLIGGHAHIDHAMSTDGGIPVIITTCDSTGQDSGGLDRTLYTVTEQAFDVITINYSTRKINCTRIGAGNDREFSF